MCIFSVLFDDRYFNPKRAHVPPWALDRDQQGRRAFEATRKTCEDPEEVRDMLRRTALAQKPRQAVDPLGIDDSRPGDLTTQLQPNTRLPKPVTDWYD